MRGRLLPLTGSCLAPPTEGERLFQGSFSLPGHTYLVRPAVECRDVTRRT
jgi:hypothetical protein